MNRNFNKDEQEVIISGLLTFIKTKKEVHENEIREFLSKKGLPNDVIELIVVRLKRVLKNR